MCQGNAQTSQRFKKEEQGFTRLQHVPHSGRKGRTVLNRRKRRKATNRGKIRVSTAAIAVRILTPGTSAGKLLFCNVVRLICEVGMIAATLISGTNLLGKGCWKTLGGRVMARHS
jgi:hypothetical protein